MPRVRPSGNCTSCGTFRLTLHRDHIVPKYKGGTDEPSNIQFICANCHEDKTRVDMTGRPISMESRKKLREASLTQWQIHPEAESMRQRLRDRNHLTGREIALRVKPWTYRRGYSVKIKSESPYTEITGALVEKDFKVPYAGKPVLRVIQ